jgi:chromosome partitioning protein
LKKIAIANRKGGVGKTTTSVHIAAALALAEIPTLLIDTDSQGHCQRLLGVDATGTLDTALHGDGVHPVKARDNLDILTGSKGLHDLSTIQSGRRYRREEIMTEALAGLTGYEYVIIDTSPGFGDVSINVLFYADSVLIPVSMEALSLEGLLSLQQEIEEIAEHTPLSICAIVPTFADGRAGKTDDILRNLKDTFADLVTDPIRYSAAFSDLAFSGQTIYEKDSRNRGATDYAKLTAAIS